MTRNQKIEAYTMLLDGNTYEAVAHNFGVTRQHINKMFPHMSSIKRMDRNKCVYPAIFEFIADTGMSRFAFSERAGISSVTLYDVLNGKCNPSKETIDKILAATGLTYEVAFRRKDNSDGGNDLTKCSPP